MRAFLAFALIATILILGCVSNEEMPPAPPGNSSINDTAPIGMPNPASKYCVEKGYKNEIRKNADGSETGYCLFPNGKECEEWQFFRGECSIDGAVMTQRLCESARGNWNECGSACRGAPEGTACTLQCVTYCECGGIAGFGCPTGYRCTDYLPSNKTPDAVGICKPSQN